MKFRSIRRAVATVLALTLTLSLIAPAWAAETPTLTITSEPAETKTLEINDTVKLKPAWSDEKGPEETVTYTWSCDVEGKKFVSLSGSSGDSVTVTAIAAGTATVTLEASWGDTPEKTSATYTLTVNEKTTPLEPSLTIAGSTTIVWTSKTTNWNLTALPSDIPEGAEIRWTVDRIPGNENTKLPKFKTDTKDLAETGTGNPVTVVSSGAGEFIFTVEAVVDGKTVASAIKHVIISGIVLSGPRLVTEEDPEKGTVKDIVRMTVGGSTVLTVEIFGDAADNSAGQLEWSSSDPSVVSVMIDSGNLSAWGVGEALIKAAKGDYWADCTVEVLEDSSVIADNHGNGYTASASEPLKFWDEDPNDPGRDIVGLYTELNGISETKTKEDGDAYGLDYITNLKVSPNQGTLYYNYSTESDTGAGVAYNDQFAKTARGTIRSLDRLYFVPKPGFSGTAEITFSGVALNRRNFSGIIRVEVGAGSNGSDSEVYQISYRALAGEPVWFQADDFNIFCQGKTGRSYNYIFFNLPRTSEGVLYYNYVAGSGNPVTTATRFTPSGRYTLDDVCFVPNAAYNGKVIISFRGADTAGQAFSGEVEVNVISTGAGDSSSVTLSGDRGRPVTLVSSLFNVACQATIGDTLSFVTFKLPDPDVGTLYINYRGEEDYDSRVTAGTRCYYSGVPGLSSVSFVPASNAAGRVAISYTGYGSGSASFSGTLYIDLGEVDRSTIYYSVPKGGSVTFSAADFYNAGLYQKGVGVDYVTFDLSKILRVPNTNLGTLYYNYRGSGYYNTEVNSWTEYYYSPRYSWQNRLGLISFHAEAGAVGTITIPYTAVCGTGSSQQTFDGKVIIQVGAVTPEDINLSCRVSGQAWLSASTLNYVCDAVMSGSLSYIEITSVPTPEKGRLYFGYSGFGTGTAVKQGDRFYRVGSSNIGQLSFVPHARFTGKTEITYIGYSVDGLEQVSGRIVVNVSNSPASQYFNDMNGHTWAIDSVDYLRRNGTVIGVGDDCYNPSGTVTKGDFTLMLVRAYGLTANGSVSFNDVPADSYYADAIRIAALLGVAGGSNGNYGPQTALNRQDAMVMIYNTLKVSGKTTTNGLAADLSGYYDEGQIAAYAREAMGNLVQMGVVKGDGDGYLRPLSLLNRAEAAVLLHTIMTL